MSTEHTPPPADHSLRMQILAQWRDDIDRQITAFKDIPVRSHRINNQRRILETAAAAMHYITQVFDLDCTDKTMAIPDFPRANNAQDTNNAN